ncbi:hypothetical protein SAMN05421835_111176 [Amycolatopsis sacchari]|uniref:Uncharacterized protein n=1 Tax=Amycolatopsis sacchari TaxID=115433 RepID=A0A1I3VU58_9PSEU|nr:hypothetical protein [Amycolatopsis sacchari]SFJ97806.1 hypothetical protein SAMN05421835_111176 [Amycolatopsis sacchari]
MGQSRSRYSLSRIDPFSLCAIIPALGLAGLCGVSGFLPGAVAFAVLALAIVALEVWIHRREPTPPPPRRAPVQNRAPAANRPPAARRPPQQQPPVARRQPPPPPRRAPAGAPPPPARRQQPPPRPRMH